jgi:ketosteroid isomerase-like protein
MSCRRVVAIISLLGSALLAGAVANAQNEADQIRAAERERLRSLVEADVETARRLHADDFQLINPIGGTLSKEQYVGQIASGRINYIEWEPGPIEVKVYGDAAVIRYQAQLKIVVEGLPNAPSGRFWHTDLYEKRNGRWQAVWSQATQIQ